MTAYDGAGSGRLNSPEQTRELGRHLARQLRPGDLVILSGPLGAGKTALTQGIGAGLGVRGGVTSPTFVLARVHPGPVPLVHVDAYRVRDLGPSGLEGLDLELALEDSVVVIEWGEGLAAALSDSWLEIDLQRAPVSASGDPDEEGRSVRLRAVGPRWVEVPFSDLWPRRPGRGG